MTAQDNGSADRTGPASGVEVLRRRVRVALGQEPGDLVLTGGQVVNVFTGIVQSANVVVADGWIAGVGPYEWKAKESIDLAGKAVIPGLIDSHMHLESTLLAPAELARLVVPHGTTATISDSHEVGNVLGVPGIETLIRASAGLPFDLFFMASSCVPATAWEHAGAVLGIAEVRDLLGQRRVLGLAEMMDVPAVLKGDPAVLGKVQASLAEHRVVDGHAPGMYGRDLMAYISAGIRSDHESGTVEEARAKAGWGMLVQVRDGSTAHNLDTLLPLLASGELGDDWTLVTDDVMPDDLRARGHIDGLLRRLVAGGVAPGQAVRHATLVPARHYGLNDRGAVAPGYRADLVVVDDLRDFRPALVFKDGRLVAREGRCVAELPASTLPAGNTVHIAPLDESAFVLNLHAESCPVIRIVPGQLVTRAETQSVRRQDGRWAFDPGRDVVPIASIERHRASGNVGLGLVAGFSLRRHGALGSSVAHDSHNLIIAGTNPRDMLACAGRLAELGGGFVVASEGAVRAELPLPFAGLLSAENADTVCRQLGEVRRAAGMLGCELEAPFGMLSFLALSVIPALRVTDQGLWDVVGQRFVPL
jgi:adenine deaminase